MTDGPLGIQRVCTRHGDNLDDWCWRNRGGRARAGVIGHSLHDHGGERCVTARLGFHLLQLGGEGTPPPPPPLDRPAIAVHLAHDVALGGSRREGQKHLGAPHQTLGAGLTADNRLQAGPLSCGQLHSGGDGRKRRHRGGHTSSLSEELGHFWLI